MPTQDALIAIEDLHKKIRVVANSIDATVVSEHIASLLIHARTAIDEIAHDLAPSAFKSEQILFSHLRVQLYREQFDLKEMNKLIAQTIEKNERTISQLCRDMIAIEITDDDSDEELLAQQTLELEMLRAEQDELREMLGTHIIQIQQIQHLLNTINDTFKLGAKRTTLAGTKYRRQIFQHDNIYLNLVQNPDDDVHPPYPDPQSTLNRLEELAQLIADIDLNKTIRLTDTPDNQMAEAAIQKEQEQDQHRGRYLFEYLTRLKQSIDNLSNMPREDIEALRTLIRRDHMVMQEMSLIQSGEAWAMEALLKQSRKEEPSAATSLEERSRMEKKHAQLECCAKQTRKAHAILGLCLEYIERPVSASSLSSSSALFTTKQAAGKTPSSQGHASTPGASDDSTDDLDVFTGPRR